MEKIEFYQAFIAILFIVITFCLMRIGYDSVKISQLKEDLKANDEIIITLSEQSEYFEKRVLQQAISHCDTIKRLVDQIEILSDEVERRAGRKL
jgi:hypothetical protein